MCITDFTYTRTLSLRGFRTRSVYKEWSVSVSQRTQSLYFKPSTPADVISLKRPRNEDPTFIVLKSIVSYDVFKVVFEGEGVIHIDPSLLTKISRDFL